MSRSVASGMAALALAGLSVIATAGPAAADPCPAGTYPPNSDCTYGTFTNKTVVTPGGTITISANGYLNNSTGEITFLSTEQTLASFQADSNGNVTVTVTIPNDADPGVHHLNVKGTAPDGSPRILSTQIRVAAGNGLPLTGTEISLASALGLSLVGAGSIAVVAGRRRKNAASPV